MNVSDLVMLIFYYIYLNFVSGIVTEHAASGFNRVKGQIVNADIDGVRTVERWQIMIHCLFPCPLR